MLNPKATLVMQPKDWIPVIGWFVVFILGIVSGGVVVPRLTLKRKIMAWGVAAETELVPRELSQTLGVPVVLQVGAERPSSLTSVVVVLACTGNEILENLSIALRFGEKATILNIRSVMDLGEFGKYISWTQQHGACQVEVDFLNPKSRIELEFLLSEYEAGSVDVDVAGPGLTVRRSDPSGLNVPASLLRGLKFGIFGVAYEPSAVSMAEIAEELKAIRRNLRK
jgi:hypothetical protein